MNKPSQKRRKVKSDSPKYITESEFTQMVKGAKAGRHAVRDAAIVRLVFEHGLRASELVKARRVDVKLKEARFQVKRLKGSLSTQHPLSAEALKAVKAYLRTRSDSLPQLFITERGESFTRQGLHYLVGAIAKRAGLHHVHPHMLRHGCGFALANRGRDTRLIQDYLGHRDIRNTALYTATAARRFEGLWDKG